MDRRSPDDDAAHDRDGHRDQPPATEGGDGAGQPNEAARLQAVVEDLRVAERRIASAVLEASELEAVGVAERVTGQPLSFALGVACRLTGADRATLLAAGDVLDDMATLRQWFADGHVSWGEVRAITQALAKRSKADRHTVDARLAATFPTDGTPACMEPDELIDAARAAVADCRDAADAAGDDADAIADSFLSIQCDFHGGARVYGEWDPVTAAGILTGLDAASPTPARHTIAPTTTATAARAAMATRARVRVRATATRARARGWRADRGGVRRHAAATMPPDCLASAPNGSPATASIPPPPPATPRPARARTRTRARPRATATRPVQRRTARVWRWGR